MSKKLRDLAADDSKDQENVLGILKGALSEVEDVAKSGRQSGIDAEVMELVTLAGGTLQHFVGMAMSAWASELAELVSAPGVKDREYAEKKFDSAAFHLQYCKLWDQWHRKGRWAAGPTGIPDKVDETFLPLDFVSAIHMLGKQAFSAAASTDRAAMHVRTTFALEAFGATNRWKDNWQRLDLSGLATDVAAALRVDIAAAGVAGTRSRKLRCGGHVAVTRCGVHVAEASLHFARCEATKVWTRPGRTRMCRPSRTSS